MWFHCFVQDVWVLKKRNPSLSWHAMIVLFLLLFLHFAIFISDVGVPRQVYCFDLDYFKRFEASNNGDLCGAVL